MFDTQLAVVVYGGMLGIPRARCLVSLLERRPLSWSRSKFTSVVSPAR